MRRSLRILADWAALLRLPNLLTVPGDALAGSLLAGAAGFRMAAAPAFAAAVAVLLIYMAGLALNDWIDLREDRRERPWRPLPAGRIAPPAALTAAAVMAAAGWGIARTAGPSAGGVAAVLTGAVAGYNLAAKKLAVTGALNMGLCRGLSLWLGAAAVGRAPLPDLDAVTVAAAGLTLTVAGITLLARDETAPAAGAVWRAWLPASAQTVCYAALFAFRWPGPAAVAAAIASVAWSSREAIRLRGCKPAPEQVGVTIAGLIRGLLLVQAVYLLAAGTRFGTAAAGLALVLIPLHRRLSRRFAPT